MRLRLAAAAVLLLIANLATAETVSTVLTPDSTIYAIETTGDQPGIVITRRHEGVRETLLVPGTDDEAVENDPRIAFEDGTLYAAWHRQADGIDEIRVTTYAAGQWSDALVIASGSDRLRSGLQIALTQAPPAEDESSQSAATLLHASWWEVGTDLTPRYALIAFESGQYVSTEIADLRELTADPDRAVAPFEETGRAIHPLLAIARTGHSVDVVFGDRGTTSVTRVRIDPKFASEARIWRPIGRTIQRTAPSRLKALGSAPVQAFISRDRVVIYTPDALFRYSIFYVDRWEPIRMITLDERLTSDNVLREIRRTVEDADTLDNQPREK